MNWDSTLQTSTPRQRERLERESYGINSKRRVFTWRENVRGARFRPSCVTKIDRFDGKGILVCGGIMLGQSYATVRFRYGYC
ncbi:hypothetical protein TNCV_1902381 [Trichonephila clavipes]|nr:hypothetical protein TNCV_1902381 [Trichonephila clavipes]